MSDECDEQPFIQEPKRTPLPVVPLLVIFLIQFAEPITGTVIYPFINQFVRATGVTDGDERKTGYFAGLLQSLFFLAEAVTVFYWGRASDRFGRKPILLLGPLGLSCAMLSFGLSNNFWMLVLCRCLQGVFNGNIGVSKTVMAEVTDSTNIADAFALMPLVWTAGLTIGPIIGGVLSEPATRWPLLFGNEFFVHYPYFLPCAMAALIAFLSAPIGFLCLPETCQSVLWRRKWPRRETMTTSPSIPNASIVLLADGSHAPNYGSSGMAADDSSAEFDNAPPGHPIAPSSSQLPLSAGILLVYGFTSFMDMCITALQPLVWSTSIPLGGLGLDPFHIGWIMGIWGILNALFQMTFLGHMIRRFGPKNVVLFAFSCYVMTFMLYPVLSFFARSTGKVDAKVWMVLLVQLIVAASSFGAFAHQLECKLSSLKMPQKVRSALPMGSHKLCRLLSEELRLQSRPLCFQYR